jgi:hypothetical protein
VSKRTWSIVGVVFVLLALSNEPDRSAQVVEQTWDGVFGGAGSLMDGFFTFMEQLTD